VRTVRVPVSVDLESGHVSAGRSMRDVAGALRDWGVAGANLEDGAVGCDEAARRIGALREARSDLFVNARVDLFLHGSHDDPLNETVRRMGVYERAGADGIFVPGALDAATIEKLARASSLPLNVWPIRNAPLAAVRDAGARRVTFGPQPCLLAWSTFRARVHAWLGASDSSDLTYASANELFAR
jgi:2-methylisocitrate lyase-like PEP mutase family enzyme